MTVFMDYARRGRNALWRYLVASPLAIVLGCIIGIVIMTALTLAHVLAPLQQDALLDPTHPVRFMLLTGGSFACLLLGVVIAVRWLHGKRFTDLLGAWSWRLFGLGAAIWLVVCVVLTGVDVALAPGSVRWSANAQTGGYVLAAVVALVPQTFCEELIFRGYLTQGLLLALRRPLPAALASGVLFGLLHIPNGAPQATSALLFGVLFALIAIRLGGLAFTFGLHLANNLFGAVVVASTSDVFHSTPALFSQNAPQLMWSDAALSVVALAVVGWLVARREAVRDQAFG